MRTLEEVRKAAKALHDHTSSAELELVAVLIAELAHHIGHDRSRVTSEVDAEWEPVNDERDGHSCEPAESDSIAFSGGTWNDDRTVWRAFPSPAKEAK